MILDRKQCLNTFKTGLDSITYYIVVFIENDIMSSEALEGNRVPMLPQLVNTEGRYTMLLAWEIVIVTFRFQVFLYGITRYSGENPKRTLNEKK